MAQTILDKTKLALRITTSTFDSELTDLLSAAETDLSIAGVVPGTEANEDIVNRAMITYVKLHFGEPDNYDRLKASYDEQKAQLRTATNYTEWGD